MEKNDSKTLRKFKKLGVNINGGKAGERSCAKELPWMFNDIVFRLGHDIRFFVLPA